MRADHHGDEDDRTGDDPTRRGGDRSTLPGDRAVSRRLCVGRRYGWLDEARIGGEVVEAPWQDFAHDRSLSLAKLRERADIDYVLVMDADDALVFQPGFDPARFKASLDKPCYDVEIRQGLVKFWRPQLFSNRLPFRYRGVLHEFLAGPKEASALGFVTELRIAAGSDGVRARNPNKWRDDVATLGEALEAETDPVIRARYTYYLAQSYREIGDQEKARELFLARAALPVWPPERALSLYQAACLTEALGHPDTMVIGAYLAAYEADPSRAEALHAAMSFCRRKGAPHQGYLIGKHAITMTEPARGLFVEAWIYDYGILEEFTVVAYQSGHYRECLDAIERLLADGKIPPSAGERLRANARVAAARLADPVAAAGSYIAGTSGSVVMAGPST
jgi:hypothetical protein